MQNEYEQARQQFDPIYYLIGFVIFMLLYCLLNKDKKKAEVPIDPRKRIFTKEELARYNGITMPQTYLACQELVFDVTGADFYTKGGAYEKFAGRDMTMAAAYYSTEDKYLDMEWHPELRL